MPKEIEQTTISKTDGLFQDISKYIEEARSRASTQINDILLIRNWLIGHRINKDILKLKKAEYGQQLVTSLAKKLANKYGRGYSKTNLFNMIKCARVFPYEKFQTVSGKLGWSHIVELVGVEDENKRDFYIEMCRLENWDIRTLKKKIGYLTYERTAIAKKPEDIIKNEIDMIGEHNRLTPELVFRDPYVLDFLDLQPPYDEKDIENAIIRDIEKFLLEFGTDFAFLARQKRITIDNEDYYADLVMYHRRLRRIIILELKNGKFNARDKGQIELYLRWFQKYETNEGENSPIGIVLCTEKSDAHVELLELESSGIHVAQFLTALPPKQLFEERLNKAIKLAKLVHSKKGINTSDQGKQTNE